MLWAAYGDALGFITELCDSKTLKYRTRGLDKVTRPVQWRRKLGGRYGVSIELPMGCYSDDTQLRMAVCRSIMNNGAFDFETFSKIEVPVFLTYGLGMGRGTKVAGESLRKKNIQWNTNFFDTKYSRYTNGGGNGAAMRIQPHVWAASSGISNTDLIREIMRDAIITHGHPVAWVGAVFHGLILRYTILQGQCPGPDKWPDILEETGLIMENCKKDKLLKDIWLPNWENLSGKNLEQGVVEAIEGMAVDIENVRNIYEKNGSELLPLKMSPTDNYRDVLKSIDAFNPKVRGSGAKTALLSAYIAHFFSNDPRKGIELCANTLGSDTDTIATMAGAILGACTNAEPREKVLDNDYLITQAVRLHNISRGKPVSQFVYPDLLHWSPPKTPLDFLGFYDKRFALSGLGFLDPQGEAIPQKSGKNAIYWRFFKTSFGQTFLLRGRGELATLPGRNLPAGGMETKEFFSREESVKSEPILNNAGRANRHFGDIEKPNEAPLPFKKKSLNQITDLLIRSGFNEADIGRQLLMYAEEENGIEKALAFSAIIVKAKHARIKREGSYTTAAESP